MIDIHSHILPGLDDGPADRDSFLQMAYIAIEEGIHTIIATPHIIPGVYNNDTATILSKVVEANKILAEHHIDTKIIPGAEHYLDDNFRRSIQENKLCTINNLGKHVLVEFPMSEIPLYADDILFEIQLKGITPILAHPERNAGVLRNPAHLYKLLSKGVLLQINASSLSGHFCNSVTSMAKTLLEHDWVHFIASDAHSAGVRSPKISDGLKIVREIIGEKADQLVIDNPQMLIKGKEIKIGEIKPYIPTKKSLFSKIKKYFTYS